MNESNNIEIRLCKTWDECVQCEEVQRRVWDMPDFRDVVPASFLITAAKNGGLLVGAFDGAHMVGFAFGVLGCEGAGAARRLKHTSHMLGILPHMRVKGLGAQLKWRQRQAALEQDLDLMTWTYDPLQAVNAYLNLARLGAIARRYTRNAYGAMTDALNAGIASDRFEVEWFLTHERVTARASGRAPARPFDDAPALYEIAWTRHDFPAIAAERALDAATVRVEIPADINALKARDLALAVEWRERTRATFERAFGSGYAAIDFVRRRDTDDRTRTYYVLSKTDF
jgi:predicted GNAT superfamily acetyltransferase